jgi:Cu-Zn family superoxide dismutase
MRLRTLLALFALASSALLFAGCAPKEEPPPAVQETAPAPAEPAPEPRVATAALEFKDTFPNAIGSVVFTETAGGVAISAQVNYGGEGYAGLHGFHLHEVGDCSAPDYTSAGGHFNPTGVDHGGPDAAVHHAGDFGNIEIGEDGSGSLELTSTMLSFDGDNSVIGRAVILHAGEDDLTSQPTGAAGARDACGVVQLKE